MSESTQRLTVALADRYRIDRELGAGGMATVYLAHDLKHERDVAIKALHPDLGAALGGERFLSEIRTTARLQHPHILPLLDSGEADGLLYYVMPLVTGETLRARLERERQLPIADAVRIAREVASALDYAHRQSVIHRDIKPENILLHDGQAIVADFGIALAVQSAGGTRMTQTELSLGTPQSMSPEQAMGERTIDARSDVYALGTVLYEMLAGDAPFTGGSAQAIVAKVLSERPTALHTLRDTVPTHVEQTVCTALAKLPADRFASAAEFATALSSTSNATFASSTAPTPARSVWRDARTWLAFSVVVVSVALVALSRMRPAMTGVVSRQQVLLWESSMPPALAPGGRLIATQATIAPDGSSLVFSDSTATGFALKRKRREESEATIMAGTEAALSPFFSPDGKWVGYLTLDQKLRKVPVDGGGSVTLAEDVMFQYRTAAWLDDGTIVDLARDLMMKRVSADGGTAVPIPGWEPKGYPISAAALPGSKGFLVTVCSANCAIQSAVYAWAFDMPRLSLLVPNAAGNWYSPTGHLLYTSRDGGQYATALDIDELALTSGAVPVIESVDPVRFVMSASGTVLYSTDEAKRTLNELVWVTRDGGATRADSSWVGHFEYPTLSLDGKSIAVSIQDRSTELWIRSPDGSKRKVQPQGSIAWRPSWMPDGKSLMFVSAGNVVKNAQDAAIYRVPVDASAPATLVQRGAYGSWEAEVSRDGTWMVMRSDEVGGGNVLRARRLTGDSALVTIDANNERGESLNIALSPDNHWLAYTSNQNGIRTEVCVTSFPDACTKVLVSTGGGTEPRWSRDGRELFYESGGVLRSVSVPPGPKLAPGVPRALLSLGSYRRARNRQQYDVSPDGNRFLMIRERPASANHGVMYVDDWLAELRAKVTR